MRHQTSPQHTSLSSITHSLTHSLVCIHLLPSTLLHLLVLTPRSLSQHSPFLDSFNTSLSPVLHSPHLQSSTSLLRSCSHTLLINWRNKTLIHYTRIMIKSCVAGIIKLCYLPQHHICLLLYLHLTNCLFIYLSLRVVIPFQTLACFTPLR